MPNRVATPADLEKLSVDLAARRNSGKPTIVVCAGTGCQTYGALSVYDAFVQEVKNQGLADQINLRASGCHGFCEKGVVVVVFPEEISYVKVKAEDAAEVVKAVANKEIVERLLYVDPVSKQRIAKEGDIPFYKHQTRLVFGANKLIDPKNIDDYIALGGYTALAKAFSMSPEAVLQEVDKANLRGRGGGGFPAGKKWAETRNAPGDMKYTVVNCDEGDPGAYMDRSLMEGNPHSVIEGLIISGYAIGAKQGYVYVRQEYPIACENLGIALKQAEEYGLLGKNILGSGFDFQIGVHRGAGAFVSGESSALMSAIEGKVGEPRLKYIHTAVSGIKGKPTNLNNVETYATVPLIIKNGADWFRSIGTEGSKGTKIFSLVGKVNNTGLVEIPMGMPLRKIIYDIGGGILNDKKFKGVQTGGPSGGIIPEAHLDTPVDFDALDKLGSMMGSGGMVVMDEDTCMVDVARYFVDFLSGESCGKCIPCREGLRVLRKVLTDICDGKGEPGDLQVIEDVAEVLSDSALCALGSTAANPVLTTLKYFRDEYKAHIEEKRCPAKFCKSLTDYYIDPERCSACLICLRNCPSGAIHGGKGLVHWIEQSKCTKCGVCYDVCPTRFGAVRRYSGEPVPAPPPEGTPVSRKKEG